MADYKLNQRAKEQTMAFIHGFRTIISENWIKLFSPPELQRVLSGEDTDFGMKKKKSKTMLMHRALIWLNILRRHI